MAKQVIPVTALDIPPFNTFGEDGILLVCGRNVKECNPMTIGWGAFGIMWGKPVIMVMVRPTRHTWTFITKTPDFTVNWMAPEQVEAVRLCGNASGRDMDKFAAAKIHPAKGQLALAPVIEESILSVECRIIYTDAVKPKQCLERAILEHYPRKDYHGMFFGEVIAAAGTDEFVLKSER